MRMEDVYRVLKEMRDYFIQELGVEDKEMVWVEGRDVPYVCKRGKCSLTPRYRNMDDGVYDEIKKQIENMLDDNVVRISLKKHPLASDTVLAVEVADGTTLTCDSSSLSIYIQTHQDVVSSYNIANHPVEKLRYEITANEKNPVRVSLNLVDLRGVKNYIHDEIIGENPTPSVASEDVYKLVKNALAYRIANDISLELEKACRDFTRYLFDLPDSLKSWIMVSVDNLLSENKTQLRSEFIFLKPENIGLDYKEVKQHLHHIHELAREMVMNVDVNALLSKTLPKYFFLK